MTSFIEIPTLAYGGNDLPSIYANTADIITIQTQYDGSTKFELRDLGSESMSVTRISYLPIGMFLDVLGELARWPGVRSWSDETKAAFREPAQQRMRAAADREREAAAR